MANVISMDKKIAVLSALVEGCSVRSTVRLTGVSKGAVLRLLVAVGAACTEYHDRVVRNVTAKRVQVDEIWSFVGCKQKNVTLAKMEAGICGDVWTFTAIEAQSKLILSWLAGRRDAGCATEFLRDVADRLANRVQLTADGHKMYLTAVPDAFAEDFDYAQLVKVYGNDPEGATRYSPAQCLGTKRVDVIGYDGTMRCLAALACGRYGLATPVFIISMEFLPHVGQEYLFKSKQQDPQRGGPSELAQLLLLLMAREGKLDMEEP